MAIRPRDNREAKRRIRQMEAKRELRRAQGKRRRRDNVIAVGAAAAVLIAAVVLQLTVFNSNPSESEFAAAQAGLSSPSASPSATATNSAGTNSADIPKADTAAGKTFTGQLSLNGGIVGVELYGTTAPQAAAVYKSLTDAGYYSGLKCPRLTTADNFSVLQCGAKGADTTDDPNFHWGPLENTPANNTYPAGTIAVARTGNNAYGNGHQFFIVYKDTVIPPDSAGGYTIVGKVTGGMDVVTKIAQAGINPGSSATDGAPVAPVTIDSFSLK
ncbi:peptidylprolyl isomerase [Arthrobacter sp. MMS18-M83]|uniref:peptidylprolyl isomerase n=1 Tax=Arthrobacter sp. MMS18-M83 TaxID=2996261 RepID=UPI00227B2017|nr:peptidylprolyl isomerase [Arthrobacter sp. MMS18-M83]WAH97094.1 peptidylprolyl isomerase [Arthrobacter sp. MMS18-M83]